MPVGTSIVHEIQPSATGGMLESRVWSADQQDDVTRQMQRLRGDVAARGYQVVAAISEIASGLNDERPKRKTLLTTAKVGVSVVEQRDRLTRCGSGSLAALLEHNGRRVVAVDASDTGFDLVDDVVAAITSMDARLSGRRNATCRVAQIQACIKRCVEWAEAEAGEVDQAGEA